MSTAADVRGKWKSEVFDQATIQAITDKALDHDFSQDSKKELGSKLRYLAEVNFFTYLVTRNQEKLSIGGGILFSYEVEVNYYKEIDPNGDYWVDVADVFETLETEILNTLGNTWDGTVDFSVLPTTVPEIISTTVGSKPVWRGTKIYTAQKFVC